MKLSRLAYCDSYLCNFLLSFRWSVVQLSGVFLFRRRISFTPGTQSISDWFEKERVSFRFSTSFLAELQLRFLKLVELSFLLGTKSGVMQTMLFRPALEGCKKTRLLFLTGSADINAPDVWTSLHAFPGGKEKGKAVPHRNSYAKKESIGGLYYVLSMWWSMLLSTFTQAQALCRTSQKGGSAIVLFLTFLSDKNSCYHRTNSFFL